jgi:Immunoglobulin I-set domain
MGLIIGLSQACAQSTVTVDSTKTWIGYMNVTDLGGTPQFGSGWGTADLNAFFTGASTLTLTPNTSIDRDKPSDDYWWIGGANGAPNKIMEANMYVQDDTLAGQTVTFSGDCLTNSLNADYRCIAFIKDFVPDYSSSTPTTVDVVAGQPFTLTLDTLPGHHVQYGFATKGPDARLATVESLGKVVLAVSNTDPSLGTVASQVLTEGEDAHFSVDAKGTAPFSYQWSFGNASGTNSLIDGGRFIGVHSNVLTVSKVTAEDTGTFFVTVSNKTGTGIAQASLVIRPLNQARTNLLIDPGFEAPTFAVTSDAGWTSYNGGALKTTNDFYPNGGPNVQVLDGAQCFVAYSTGAGTYNGCLQVRPAQPGEAFIAEGWFYIPSSDPITGSGNAALEIKFLDAKGGLLAYDRSARVDAASTVDAWIHLQATNLYATDYVTSLGAAPYLVAPPGTASVQYQITYVPDTGGTVYVDSALLQLKAPVVTARSNTDSIQLSFPTLFGPTYQVLFKSSLKDAQWQVLSEIVGDGTIQSVSDPLSSKGRFYIVNTK